MMSKLKEFEKDIAAVINRHGLDNFANMPDYILAEYVTTCLAALKKANENKQLYELERIPVTEEVVWSSQLSPEENETRSNSFKDKWKDLGSASPHFVQCLENALPVSTAGVEA